MQLDIRHLRVIVAVADKGSVSRAAASLGIPQPSLSAQLRRIERHVGGQLFRRGRHGAVATPLGEFVIAKARVVLPALADLDRDAIRYAAHPRGPQPLRYGAVPGPLMAGLLEHMAERTVGSVQLRTEPTSRALADLVARRTLELAALVEYLDHPVPLAPTVNRRVIAAEPAFVLVSERSPLAERGELGMSDLVDAPWVLPPLPDNGVRESLYQACARAGFRPRLEHEAEASGARELVASGRALGVGQATFRPTAGVTARAITGTPLCIRHSLIWNTDGPVVPLAERIVSAAHDAYEDAVRRSPQYLSWLTGHARPSRRRVDDGFP